MVSFLFLIAFQDVTEAMKTTKNNLNKHGVPTLRAPRENCTAPAIEQFPPPLMSKGFRKVGGDRPLIKSLAILLTFSKLQHGGIIIHILVAVFTFLGLAIVCDDYFVSSLDRICEELKLSPDVAGAT